LTGVVQHPCARPTTCRTLIPAMPIDKATIRAGLPDRAPFKLDDVQRCLTTMLSGRHP
jgi:hypothetical protein